MNPTENTSSQSRLLSLQDAIPEHPQSIGTIHGEQVTGEIGAAIAGYFNANSQDETTLQTGLPFWQDPVSQQRSATLDEQTIENFAPDTVQYADVNHPPTQLSSAKVIPNPSYLDGPKMRIFNAVFTDWNDLNQQNKFNAAKKKGTTAIQPFLDFSHSWSELRRDLKETVVDIFIKAFMNTLNDENVKDGLTFDVCEPYLKSHHKNKRYSRLQTPKMKKRTNPSAGQPFKSPNSRTINSQHLEMIQYSNSYPPYVPNTNQHDAWSSMTSQVPNSHMFGIPSQFETFLSTVQSPPVNSNVNSEFGNNYYGSESLPTNIAMTSTADFRFDNRAYEFSHQQHAPTDVPHNTPQTSGPYQEQFTLPIRTENIEPPPKRPKTVSRSISDTIVVPQYVQDSQNPSGHPSRQVTPPAEAMLYLMKCLEKTKNIRQEEGELAAAKQFYSDFVRNCPPNLSPQISNDLPKHRPPDIQ